MRRRTAANRSTTPPPDTGLPAALSCGRASQTWPPGRLRGCVQPLGDGPVSYIRHTNPGPRPPHPSTCQRLAVATQTGAGVYGPLPRAVAEFPPTVRLAPDSFSVRQPSAASIPTGRPRGTDSSQQPAALPSIGGTPGPRRRSQPAARGFRPYTSDSGPPGYRGAPPAVAPGGRTRGAGGWWGGGGGAGGGVWAP